MLLARRSQPWEIGPIAILVLVLPHNVVCADTPSKMIHGIIQMSGTDIPAGSFASKPKIFWCASSQYCRIDEEPDPEHGIHGRLLINEPDAWLLNLADSTAKHMVDTGPTFNCRMPIFATDQSGVAGELRVADYAT
jgi:hypothetical protein